MAGPRETGTAGAKSARLGGLWAKPGDSRPKLRVNHPFQPALRRTANFFAKLLTRGLTVKDSRQRRFAMGSRLHSVFMGMVNRFDTGTDS